MNRRTTLSDVIYYIFVIAFSFLMLYPILWMFGTSFKPETEVFSNAASLIPMDWDWLNYPEGWDGFGGVGFDVFFRNSLFVTGSVVIGSLLSCSIVAYGFARINFRFRKLLFACLISTVLLPIQIILVPQYLLFEQLNWVNTFYPLIVPHFLGGTPFFIFLLIQFIRGIPRELDEAAIIDGCSRFGVFWRIVLPMLKPALVTVAIFAFMWSWDDFLTPLIYLNSVEIQTVSLGLRNFMDAEAGTSWGPLLAMSSLSLLPQFILFLFFQRYLVEGIATTGIK
ncbi:carbohydrate ABC transporter permease [Salibacterium qingdaonense]|uniref:Carbohydrate ABC transporter membrane protein 2, CUT1 family n=1 Tax=Salibacterium qingdaonense TaxID=266892 RepID=A0A1I4I2H1_9BACI|nr:carbohydrate ABC transporter permease [Salibacterium qingdaonense]SFL47956.1 carbohydrate ABC transporter membrane protein 2, CUT1 family [Salibacterium qingdaonense]